MKLLHRAHCESVHGEDRGGRMLDRLRVGLAALACVVQVPLAVAADPQTVTLFIGTTPDYANIYVARDKGFFEAEGLKLDIRLFPSGSAATDGFRSGKVEFVASGDIPAMRLCEVMGAKVIAPTGFDGFSPVFMVKSSIKGPEDLKGKTFASRLGSSGDCDGCARCGTTCGRGCCCRGSWPHKRARPAVGTTRRDRLYARQRRTPDRLTGRRCHKGGPSPQPAACLRNRYEMT